MHLEKCAISVSCNSSEINKKINTLNFSNATFLHNIFNKIFYTSMKKKERKKAEFSTEKIAFFKNNMF